MSEDLSKALSDLAVEAAREGELVEPVPSALRRSFGPAVTFRSLRHRNYRLYFFGQIVSLTGSWMQTTALMWLAYDLTHQSKWPALISAAQITPTFLFGAWGGILADRVPKRSLILCTQSALLFLAALLAALVWLDWATRWELLAITALAGAVLAIDLPARLAFVVDMVGRDDLMNAVALNSVLFNVARVLGPMAAIGMLFWLGPAACFLTNALSYAAVLWALAMMDIEGTAHHGDDRKGLHALFAGFRALAQRRRLLLLVMMAGTTALCGWPFLTLLPALAENELGLPKLGYGLTLSGTGAGALTAALTVATFGSKARSKRFIAVGVGLVSVGLVVLALVALLGSLVAAVACCAVIGFGLILFLSTSQSVVQLSADEHQRGRIMGIWAMTLSGAVPLGNLLVGPAADRWGVAWVMGAQGMACGMAALGLGILAIAPNRGV
ncbi:MAG: MFS transporter [Gemmataceae bacterium]|nr:MFS transporter [Gemmataceae bacterium]